VSLFSVVIVVILCVERCTVEFTYPFKLNVHLSMSNSRLVTILMYPPSFFLLVAPQTGIAAMSAQLQTATAQRDFYIAEQASEMVHKLSEKGKKNLAFFDIYFE